MNTAEQLDLYRTTGNSPPGSAHCDPAQEHQIGRLPALAHELEQALRATFPHSKVSAVTPFGGSDRCWVHGPSAGHFFVGKVKDPMQLDFFKVGGASPPRREATA